MVIAMRVWKGKGKVRLGDVVTYSSHRKGELRSGTESKNGKDMDLWHLRERKNILLFTTGSGGMLW